MVDAFRKADEVLLNAVQGISDLMTVPGLINVDFADVRTIMSEHGPRAHGHRHRHRQAPRDRGRRDGDQLAAARGRHRSTARPASSSTSPAARTSTLHEVNEASSLIQQAAHEDANIIFGSVIDPNLGDEVRITVIATGFERPVAAKEKQPPGRTPNRNDRNASGSQIALPYDQSAAVTREYPPPMAQRPARTTDPAATRRPTTRTRTSPSSPARSRS